MVAADGTAFTIAVRQAASKAASQLVETNQMIAIATVATGDVWTVTLKNAAGTATLGTATSMAATGSDTPTTIAHQLATQLAAIAGFTATNAAGTITITPTTAGTDFRVLVTRNPGSDRRGSGLVSNTKTLSLAGLATVNQGDIWTLTLTPGGAATYTVKDSDNLGKIAMGLAGNFSSLTATPSGTTILITQAGTADFTAALTVATAGAAKSTLTPRPRARPSRWTSGS